MNLLSLEKPSGQAQDKLRDEAISRFSTSPAFLIFPFGNHDPAAIFSSKKFFKLFSLLTDKVLEWALDETAKSLPGRSSWAHQIVNG